MALKEPLVPPDVVFTVGGLVLHLCRLDKQHVVPVGEDGFEFFLIHVTVSSF